MNLFIDIDTVTKMIVENTTQGQTSRIRRVPDSYEGWGYADVRKISQEMKYIKHYMFSFLEKSILFLYLHILFSLIKLQRNEI